MHILKYAYYTDYTAELGRVICCVTVAYTGNHQRPVCLWKWYFYHAVVTKTHTKKHGVNYYYYYFLQQIFMLIDCKDDFWNNFSKTFFIYLKIWMIHEKIPFLLFLLQNFSVFLQFYCIIH